jgi:hypothetical protein
MYSIKILQLELKVFVFFSVHIADLYFGSLADSCDHKNEPSGSTTIEEFVEYL